MNVEWEADSDQVSWHTQRNEHAWLTTWPHAHGLKMAWNTPEVMTTRKKLTNPGIVSTIDPPIQGITSNYWNTPLYQLAFNTEGIVILPGSEINFFGQVPTSGLNFFQSPEGKMYM